MDIHKPKAAHSWREFLVEIGTIICGILIALSLEQGVEWLHWRHVSEGATELMTNDQRSLVAQIGATDAVSSCLLRRLDLLKATLDRAEAEGRLPPMGDIGAPPGEPWVMRGWEGLVAGQVLTHLPPRLASELTAQAARVDFLRTQREAFGESWSILRTMMGSGRKLSAAEAAQLRVALRQTYWRAWRLRSAADALGRQIYETGLISPQEIKTNWRSGGASLAPRGIQAALCGDVAPISAPVEETKALGAPAIAPDRPPDPGPDGRKL